MGLYEAVTARQAADLFSFREETQLSHTFDPALPLGAAFPVRHPVGTAPGLPRLVEALRIARVALRKLADLRFHIGCIRILLVVQRTQHPSVDSPDAGVPRSCVEDDDITGLSGTDVRGDISGRDAGRLAGRREGQQQVLQPIVKRVQMRSWDNSQRNCSESVRYSGIVLILSF